MDPSVILAITTLFKLGGPIASLALQQLAIARQSGLITQEQFERVKADAEVSDAAWTEAIDRMITAESREKKHPDA